MIAKEGDAVVGIINALLWSLMLWTIILGVVLR
jgi:hypothetical protein